MSKGKIEIVKQRESDEQWCLACEHRTITKNQKLIYDKLLEIEKRQLTMKGGEQDE